MCRRGYNLLKNILIGLKRNGGIFCGLMRVKLFFLGYRQFVRRFLNFEFKLQYIVKIVKYGGVSIMIWVCFFYYGVGFIYRILGIMDQFVYVKIFEEVMLFYVEEDMFLKWLF